MKKKELEKLTDEELLQEAKKMKSTAIMNALLIGFIVGVGIYSVVKNGFGFFGLVPLFLAYKLINSPKEDKEALKELLKERNLKI